MDGAKGQPTAEHIAIDHPWFSNDLMPIYRWTFPLEATDEELRASLRAREDWAICVRYPAASVDVCMIHVRNCDTPVSKDEIALSCPASPS